MAKNLFAIADPHVSEQPLDQYRINFISEELPAILGRRKPEALLILGDLTEAKDRHGSRLVNQTVTALARLTTSCPVYLLMGNHDYAHEGQPFFEFVNTIPDLHWIGKPTEVTLLGKPMLMLPHTRDHVRDWKPYASKFKNYNAIFCHQTFEGATGNADRELGGIDARAVFPKGVRIFSGDIHKPQEFDDVVYIGAPYTVTFGDDYSPRGVRITAGGWNPVGLGSFPQKRMVEINKLAELKNASVNPGDIVKVRIAVDSMEDWPSMTSEVQFWAQRQHLHHCRCEPVLLKRNMRKRINIDPANLKSDADLIHSYAKRHRLDEKTTAEGVALLEGVKP